MTEHSGRPGGPRYLGHGRWKKNRAKIRGHPDDPEVGVVRAGRGGEGEGRHRPGRAAVQSAGDEVDPAAWRPGAVLAVRPRGIISGDRSRAGLTV